MCGLAQRWASRSVKNACKVGASEVIGSSPEDGFEALGDEGEQLGRAGQVPVRRPRVNVAEIGRQQGQAGGRVQVVSIPAEQRVDGKAVPFMGNSP